MYAYLIRRFLWMIPTFIGILVINFGVIRLRAPGLAEQMAQGGQSGETAGTRDAETQISNIQNYLAGFQTTGNHLPALLNLRGFADKDDALEIIQEVERGPDGLKESERLRRELDLWLKGIYYVNPLTDILRDDSLVEYHGPASEALQLCAFELILPNDDSEYKSAVRSRRDILKKNAITYTNDEANGFQTTDPEADAKRIALIAMVDEHQTLYGYSTGRALGSMVLETGFVDLMTKLFTGELYSSQRKRYVFDLIGERWGVTFTLNILSVLLAWAVSIPLGIRSARRINTLEDKITTNGLFFLWSIPSFFVGTLFLHHLCTNSSTGVQLFPNAGLSSDDSMWMNGWQGLLDMVWHATLPLIMLTYASFTALSRYMRGNMLDQLHADYARTARAKGCSEDRIVYGHALRNSMVTMITLGSGLIAELYGGFLFAEIIFSINGLGLLTYEAALTSDAPLIMGSTVISVGLLLISILVADIMYAVVDPRIRSSYA